MDHLDSGPIINAYLTNVVRSRSSQVAELPPHPTSENSSCLNLYIAINCLYIIKGLLNENYSPTPSVSVSRGAFAATTIKVVGGLHSCGVRLIVNSDRDTSTFVVGPETGSALQLA